MSSDGIWWCMVVCTEMFRNCSNTVVRKLLNIKECSFVTKILKLRGSERLGLEGRTLAREPPRIEVI